MELMKKIIVTIAAMLVGMIASAQKDSLIWETTVEGGYHIGTASSDFTANTLALNVITGIKFNNHLTVGVGAGARVYDNNNADNDIIVPVFVRLKADITNGKRVTPYVLADLGGSMFPAEGWEYVGFTSTAGAGIDVKVADRTYMSFGFNYESQHYDNTSRANAVGFAAGFTF